MTPHKNKEDPRECSVCGATLSYGIWYHPMSPDSQVPDDCDEARRIIYPSKASPLPPPFQPPPMVKISLTLLDHVYGIIDECSTDQLKELQIAILERPENLRRNRCLNVLIERMIDMRRE
jgi:hypothetical protein